MIHVKDSQEYQRGKEIVFAVLKSKLFLKSTKVMSADYRIDFIWEN